MPPFRLTSMHAACYWDGESASVTRRNRRSAVDGQSVPILADLSSAGRALAAIAGGTPCSTLSTAQAGGT